MAPFGNPRAAAGEKDRGDLVGPGRSDWVGFILKPLFVPLRMPISAGRGDRDDRSESRLAPAEQAPRQVRQRDADERLGFGFSQALTDVFDPHARVDQDRDRAPF